jgi:hypothetical protein
MTQRRMQSYYSSSAWRTYLLLSIVERCRKTLPLLYMSSAYLWISGPLGSTYPVSLTLRRDHSSIGPDNFPYALLDGLDFGNTAVVTITVYRTAPYAYDASFSVLHDRELTGQLYGYDPDGDAITVPIVSSPSVFSAQLISAPTNGTVVLNDDGRFIYTPAAGYTGTDAFVFGFTDGLRMVGLAMAWITVRNTAPLWLANEFSGSDKWLGLLFITLLRRL